MAQGGQGVTDARDALDRAPRVAEGPEEAPERAGAALVHATAEVAEEPLVADAGLRGASRRQRPPGGQRRPDRRQVDARSQGQGERAVEATVEVDQPRLPVRG